MPARAGQALTLTPEMFPGLSDDNKVNTAITGKLTMKSSLRHWSDKESENQYFSELLITLASETIRGKGAEVWCSGLGEYGQRTKAILQLDFLTVTI